MIRTLRAWRPARRTLAQQLAGASQIAACRNIAAKCVSEPASNHLDSTHVSQNDVHGTPHNAADQGDRACESERETRQSQRRQHKRRRKLLAACKLMWRSQVRLWRHFKKNERLLAVPWGLETVVQVLFLLLLAFCSLSCFVVPVVWDAFGHESTALSPRLQATSHLVLDLLQMGSTLVILWLCLRKRVPRGATWFPFEFRPTARWLPATALCCALFPAINVLTAVVHVLWSSAGPTWNMANLETAIAAGDWVNNLMYFVIVGVCAPLWEEAIFRGFLLPSLMRWLPLPAAIAASAFIFALAHAQGIQFVPLLGLGILLGGLFVYTRNLIAPIVLHGVWNILVFTQLAVPFASLLW